MLERFIGKSIKVIRKKSVWIVRQRGGIDYEDLATASD